MMVIRDQHFKGYDIQEDTFVMPLISLAFSIATFCLRSSINCIFFGRMAKCFRPRDSGVDVLFS